MDNGQWKNNSKSYFLDQASLLSSSSSSSAASSSSSVRSLCIPTVSNFLAVPYLVNNAMDTSMIGKSCNTVFVTHSVSSSSPSPINSSVFANAPNLDDLKTPKLNGNNIAHLKMTGSGHEMKWTHEVYEPNVNRCLDNNKRHMEVQTDIYGLHNQLLLIECPNQNHQYKILPSPLVSHEHVKVQKGGEEDTSSIKAKASSLTSTESAFTRERKKQKFNQLKRKKNQDLIVKLETADNRSRSSGTTIFSINDAMRNSWGEIHTKEQKELFAGIWNVNKFDPIVSTVKTASISDTPSEQNDEQSINTKMEMEPGYELNEPNLTSDSKQNVHCENIQLNQYLESLCGPDMTCLQCRKTFKQRAHLQRHVKEQHFIKEPDHICAICNKKFHQKANLTCHMLTHLKNRTYTHPFKCLLCERHGLERKFTRKSSLRRHVETKHPSCDKDAPWVIAQRKPKIARQLCENLNRKHQIAKNFGQINYGNHSIKSVPTNHTTAVTYNSNEGLNHNNNNNNSHSLNNHSIVETNDNGKNNNCTSQLGQIFPEMFLFQNPELFSHLTEMCEKDISSALPQNDVIMKLENENRETK